jgi:hypothetical protein
MLSGHGDVGKRIEIQGQPQAKKKPQVSIRKIIKT